MKPVAERRNYSNVFSALGRIAGEEGFGALYKGLAPNILRGMSMNCGMMACSDQARPRRRVDDASARVKRQPFVQFRAKSGRYKMPRDAQAKEMACAITKDDPANPGMQTRIIAAASAAGREAAASSARVEGEAACPDAASSARVGSIGAGPAASSRPSSRCPSTCSSRASRTPRAAAGSSRRRATSSPRRARWRSGRVRAGAAARDAGRGARPRRLRRLLHALRAARHHHPPLARRGQEGLQEAVRHHGLSAFVRIGVHTLYTRESI